MTELTREEHRIRSQGIGGSEAAAALGLHHGITPLDLYRHKVYGESLPMNASDFNLWLGHQLEPVVASAFTRHTGMELENPGQNYQHPEYHFIRGYIDRKVAGKDEGVELKAWSEHSRGLWGPDGSDDVPMNVLCQCVHYMLATGWECWHVGVLLGTDFRYYTIHRDDQTMKMVLDGERQFWKYVEDRQPPPAVNVHDLHYLYRRAVSDSVRQATDNELLLHAELHKAKAQKKKLELRIRDIEFQLKQSLKDVSRLVHPDDPDHTLLTWTDHDTRKADTAALRRDGLLDAYSTTVASRPLILKEPMEKTT